MSKVITTVGLSLITNVPHNERSDEFKSSYDKLLKKNADDYDKYPDEIKYMKKFIAEWIKSKKVEPSELSAEINSLERFLKEKKEDFEVYFIASDTIASRMVCELLVDYYKDHNDNIEPHFNIEQDIIKGLQVYDRKKFEIDGMTKLINRIYSIIDGVYYENVYLNITGGFKGSIPFLTIFGQVNNIKTFYIFERSEELIYIPQVPIDINWDFFDLYKEEFYMLSPKEGDNEIINKDKFDYQFLTKGANCLEIDNKDVVLNPLGKILWDRYRKNKYIFYCPDDVWKEIENNSEIKDKISSKEFQNKESREANIERKKGNKHKAYGKKGMNTRIFYFEQKDKLYIYKVFPGHNNEYEDYINAYTLDKDIIIKKSKPRFLEVKNV